MCITNFRIIMFASFLSILLSGCLGSNSSSSIVASTYSPEKVKANLVIGKTTKDEVRNMYGGASRSEGRDGETWYYSHKKKEDFTSTVGKNLVKRGIGKLTAHLPMMGYMASSNELVGEAGTVVGYEAAHRVHDRVNEELPSKDEWQELTIEFDKKGVVKSYHLY